jgi:hypothetical protein
MKCEGSCGKYFEDNDLDIEDGKFLCRECEDELFFKDFFP